MVTLANLPKTIVGKRSKRLGRGAGSGVGAKSGRGTTRHQKAREDIPLAFEGGQGRMTKKFPLTRGKGRNKSIFKRPAVVKLGNLANVPDNTIIDKQYLIENKFIDKSALKNKVKIVDGGEIKNVLVIKLPISQKARTAVEKAGGKVELPILSKAKI
jgi:large subunit ribosomal protein L15